MLNQCPWFRITDVEGNPTQFVCYMPFGEAFVDEHTIRTEMPFKFNGKEQDSETGLYYYGARYYEPRECRFYGVDPMAEDSRSWSPYRYAYNNPLRFIDPDGMQEDDFFFDKNDKLIHYEENDKPDRVFVRNTDKEAQDPEASYMQFDQVEMKSEVVEQKMDSNGYKKVTKEANVYEKSQTVYMPEPNGPITRTDLLKYDETPTKLMYVGENQERIGHTDKNVTFNDISDSKQCRMINEKWSTQTFQYGTVKGGSTDGIKNAGKQLIPWGDVGEKLYKLIKSL